MGYEEVLTEDEIKELQKFVASSPTTSSDEEKTSLFKFLDKVATAQDTTKLGFLSDEELGVPKHPVRMYKELAAFSSHIANMEYFGDYFLKLSEITTSTSLSKGAKLLSLAVISRRQLEDVTKRKQKPRGFFKKREEEQQQE